MGRETSGLETTRSQPRVDAALALIVGRVVDQGSKLSLCNQASNTCFWELCRIPGQPDVDDHCYDTLVLDDITSSYFEGESTDSELVDFGYNRDQKKGHKQIVVGLLCNDHGCPVGCEVFKGNPNEATPVTSKIPRRQGPARDSFIQRGGKSVPKDSTAGGPGLHHRNFPS